MEWNGTIPPIHAVVVVAEVAWKSDHVNNKEVIVKMKEKKSPIYMNNPANQKWSSFFLFYSVHFEMTEVHQFPFCIDWESKQSLCIINRCCHL